MRIGIDARLYLETGVGRYIRNLIYWLNRLDKKNYYFIFGRKDDLEGIPLSKKWKKCYVDIRWHSLKEQIIFPFLINQYHLDLLHFPYFSVPVFYLRKFIVTIHDLTPLFFATGRASTRSFIVYNIKKIGYKLVLKNIFFRASKIIVPSFTIASQIKKISPNSFEKVSVIYEGGIFVSKKQKKLPFEPFILYVGNVYPHKNIENALLAFQKLRQKNYQSLKLIIVGKKDFFQNRLKVFINSLNLRDHVRFIEKINDEDLSNLYKRALCLIFPSISEGFGLPALEAMQHGCLIACSDIPIFHEICQDLPFYFNPLDIIDIAKKLEHILSLPEEKKIYLRSKEIKRASEFSWKRMVEQTLKLYQEVGNR